MYLVNVATTLVYFFYYFSNPATDQSSSTNHYSAINRNYDSSCGVVLQRRIVGGVEADPLEWPWMANVRAWEGRHFCGGVLISERHILTAAHCISTYKYAPFLLRVSLGSRNILKGDTYFVKTVYLHPSYKRLALHDSDIAILTLFQTVTLHPGTTYICLPQQDLTYDSERSLIALGWGKTAEKGYKSSVLREVSLQRFPHRCEVYGKLWLEEKMICAGGLEGGKDSCQGDSGGPLMQQDINGKWTVFGITAFGLGCGRVLYPGVYTNVYYFRSWIDNLLIK